MSATAVSPTARQIWSHGRGLLIAAAVLAVAGVALAALRSGEHHGFLDPRSADGHGTRAAARLLADRGVETEVVTSSSRAAAAAGPDTTVLISQPDLLDPAQLDELRGLADRGGRTVLVAPGPSSVTALAPGLRTADDTVTADVRPTSPGCRLPAAERAGTVTLGGVRYQPEGATAHACYPHHGLPTLVIGPAARGGDTVVLGTPAPLHNDRLDDHGNASLTLQLLGSRPHLVWYLPSLADPAAGTGDRSFFTLVPDGWTWATVQLAVAAVLAALWRARRLGPLVTENLPVAVHASETTEGRARLYRRAGARAQAAHALRAACRARLAPRLGVSAGRAHTPEILLPALNSHFGHSGLSTTAARATGRTTGPLGSTTEVADLLFGPSPPDDAALLRLADELDALEAEVTADTAAGPPTAPGTPGTPAPPTSPGTPPGAPSTSSSTDKDQQP